MNIINNNKYVEVSYEPKNTTTIYLEKTNVYKIIGFLRYEIFEERASLSLIKDFVNVKRVIFYLK